MMVNNATNMNNYPVGAVRCVTCGKHIHDCFISSRFEVYAHKTNLILPLFIEVPMLSQESERSCICLLEVSILSLSMTFSFFALVSSNWMQKKTMTYGIGNPGTGWGQIQKCDEVNLMKQTIEIYTCNVNIHYLMKWLWYR